MSKKKKNLTKAMVKIKTSRTKKPPDGFYEIEPILNEFADKMKQAESESHEGKTKTEALWPIIRINHQRSRYIYELYYKKEAISTDLYQWLLKQNYADALLIAKWKKQGYENLCCVQCIQTNETSFGTTCICRVPKARLAGKEVQCRTCGCRGCASSD